MDTEKEFDFTKAKDFARTLLFNIQVYFARKLDGGTEFGEYKFCKLYSNYCHAVILHYLDLNGGIFNYVKDYIEIGRNAYLMEFCASKLKEWQKVDEHPSDSEMYIFCAKKAIIAVIESKYNSDAVDKYECNLIQYIQNGMELRVFIENYDINRISFKNIVSAVYEWHSKDLVDFATKPDITHGWIKTTLSDKCLDYLNSKGLALLRSWKDLEYNKEMDKSKFLTLLKQMHEFPVGLENNETFDKIYNFLLNASLLSLHCCVYCNFSPAAELVIDRLNILMDMGPDWITSIDEMKTINARRGL